MSPREALDGSYVYTTRPTVIIGTSKDAQGAKFIETFRGPVAHVQAAAFRTEQEGYGCTVTLQVLP